MSRLTDLLAQARIKDPQLAADLDREFRALSSRRAFGLNFERHRPEAVELAQRPVRKGDKVRVLLARGSTKKGDQRLWVVRKFGIVGESRVAELELLGGNEPVQNVLVDDLVVVAEFRDFIYPGLVSTGKVERGGNKPFHTVINGENYHALKALTYTHQGKIDAIYIDPPYNTGAKDWKYNNDYVEGDDQYQHSKWLAFMERRLEIARDLLSSSGTLIVTVDEHEVHRLGLLLDQIFLGFVKQMVSIVVNPRGVTQDYLSRVEEYAIFCFGPQSTAYSGPDDLLTHRQAVVAGEGLARPRWKGLLRSGDEARRIDREQMFFPVWVNPRTKRLIRAGEWLPLDEQPDFSLTDESGNVVAWPVRNDLSLGRWGLGSCTLNKLIELGYAAAGGFDRRRNTWGVSYLSEQIREELDSGTLAVLGRDELTGVADVAYLDVPSRRVRTVWHRTSHDAGVNGTDLLRNILGAGRTFPFPKSLYAVEDALRIVTLGKPEALVLDFFSGSGTTAHAVMRLNRQDDGCRQSISVTNNEVAADEQIMLSTQGLRRGDPDWERFGICDHITKPRVEAAIRGKKPSGVPISGDYRFTDEFPMAEGFEENAEFFTLTYETPVAVSHNLSFSRIAPLLWMRAGSRGRRIDSLPAAGWDVADTYGLLTDLDQTVAFCTAAEKAVGIKLAYIVTDDDRRFQHVAQRLPGTIDAIRLYESYLSNFRFATGE